MKSFMRELTKRFFSGSYDVMDDVTYYTFSDEQSDEFWDFHEKMMKSYLKLKQKL